MIAENKLKILYRNLVHFALHRNIPLEVAEELSDDTLLVACNEYDESRGKLESFCYAILLNKIRNYVRDKDENDPYFDDEFFSNLEDNPLSDLINKERAMMAKQFLNKLILQLDEEEKKFFFEYQNTLDELGKRAVSETARRLGIDVDKGIAIIKRISRKARKLRTVHKVRKKRAKTLFTVPRYHKVEEKISACLAPKYLPDEDTRLIFNISNLDSHLITQSFDTFWEKLTDQQRQKLSLFTNQN